MPHSNDPRAAARPFTPVPELNAVLGHLLSGVERLLGDNFIGAYLQGSFAVGDANAFSDCDFIIVARRDLTPDELPPFQALHAAIHDLPHPRWRNALEGSYAPADILRRPPAGEAFWYLDHGAKQLVRSDHDNSLVMRWCLREKGVTLAGPDPKTLVDPVSAEALRVEVRRTMEHRLSLSFRPIDNRGWLAFWVGLYCRMAHTMVTGAVASKKAGTDWALAHLDRHWRGLIERTQAVGKASPQAFEPAPADDVAAAREFAGYVIDWTDRRLKSQALIAARLASSRGGAPRFDPRGGGKPGGGQFTPPPMRPGSRRGRG